MSVCELPAVRPVHRRIRGKTAPLRVFDKLYAHERYAFLYESLEGHGARGRYSFIGGRPRLIFKSKGTKITLRIGDREQHVDDRPLDVLRRLVQSQTEAPPVATFPGGAVGYLSYDAVRLIESIPDANPDDLDLPDCHFIFPQEIVILDHLDEVVHILLYREDGQDDRARQIEQAIADCEEQDDEPFPGAPGPPEPGAVQIPLKSNMTEAQFVEAVEKAKEYIVAGDVFQVVLSQRFEFPMTTSPLSLYKALRLTNPSPYLYYLNFDDRQVLGSSPEVLVKLAGRRVISRPLAGTRPRGATSEEDRALGEELQADEKERAEHVMLVDLARNDIGRVCKSGSIQLTDLLEIERYSKVMHMVSNVEGRLRDDADAFDLFEATFPAGTVSGAPKIRAMEIIDELEPVKRGLYAGAIGYFSHLGDMDLCIAIRTMLVQNGTGYIQAGAGIVADSVPQREYAETLSKATGLIKAVHLAASHSAPT